MIPDPIQFGRLVRKARMKFAREIQCRPELKFTKSSDRLRRFILEGLAKTDASVVWTGIAKPTAMARRSQSADVLIRLLSRDVCSEVFGRICARSFDVVMDRRWTKEKTRNDLDEEIELAAAIRHCGHFAPDVKISHFDSRSSPGLQVADFVAGALFQKFERANGSYCDIISKEVTYGRMC